MFSSDPRIDETGSPSGSRMQRYREVLERLDIIPLDRSSGGRLLRFWHGYWKARQYLKEDRYDIIVAQDIEHAFLAVLLKWEFSTPFQMQLHTDIFSPFFYKGSFINRLRIFFAKRLITKATCIRVVSERIENSIRKSFPNHEFRIVRMPIPPIITQITKWNTDIPFKPQYAEGHDFIILMVARLEKEKNIPLALEVFKEFLSERPKALLVIAGRGSQKEDLKHMCNRLGIQANVEFLNGYTREYEIADVLLLTSNYEGYGLVALEALYNGVPVIMTDVGVAGEVVKDNINGFVVPVSDKKRLLESLLKYSRDVVLQNRFKEQAKLTSMPYDLASDDDIKQLLESWRTCTTK